MEWLVYLDIGYVSSEKQAQASTIASQITALEERISMDGYPLLDECKFIHNGYSGSNINRPALEKLQNKVPDGELDKIYVHSPDRLSRRSADLIGVCSRPKPSRPSFKSLK